MYLPPAFRVDDRYQVREMLSEAAFGHLVALSAGGGDAAFESTPMPFVVRGDESWTIAGHVARANPIVLCGGPALLIVPGADTYVSPSWYPTKAIDGRVVPTSNYEVVHLHGRLVIQDDATWVRALLDELTHENEAPMPTPWSVSDAPGDFIDKQLRAIVGIEVVVERVQAKRKLSQNRTDADRIAVIDGLADSPHRGAIEVRNAMRRIDG